MPTATWTMVFRITATDDDCCDLGDRIIHVQINDDGYFSVSSHVNGNSNYYKQFHFEVGKKYHISIQQWKENEKYWYEITIDGLSKFKIENSQPKQFSNVKLYATSPWQAAFTSDFGSICSIKIQQEAG